MENKEKMLIHVTSLILIICFVVAVSGYTYGQIVEFDRVEDKLNKISNSNSNYFKDSKGNMYRIEMIKGNNESIFLWNTTIIDP